MLDQIKKATMLLSVVLLASACSHKKATNTDAAADASDANLMNEFVQQAGNKVHFGFDSANLSKEGKASLDNQIAFLKAHGSVKITIEGHCDERGTEEYNLALAEKRANSVKMYFGEKGIALDNVEIISYGKERPEVLDHNEAAWSQNRRAVTILK